MGRKAGLDQRSALPSTLQPPPARRRTGGAESALQLLGSGGGRQAPHNHRWLGPVAARGPAGTLLLLLGQLLHRGRRLRLRRQARHHSRAQHACALPAGQRRLSRLGRLEHARAGTAVRSVGGSATGGSSDGDEKGSNTQQATCAGKHAPADSCASRCTKQAQRTRCSARCRRRPQRRTGRGQRQHPAPAAAASQRPEPGPARGRYTDCGQRGRVPAQQQHACAGGAAVATYLQLQAHAGAGPRAPGRSLRLPQPRHHAQAAAVQPLAVQLLLRRRRVLGGGIRDISKEPGAAAALLLALRPAQRHGAWSHAAKQLLQLGSCGGGVQTATCRRRGRGRERELQSQSEAAAAAAAAAAGVCVKHAAARLDRWPAPAQPACLHVARLAHALAPSIASAHAPRKPLRHTPRQTTTHTTADAGRPTPPP